MDSMTQILLGSAVQAAFLGKFQRKKALLYGAILGTLPDLDVLIPHPDVVTSVITHRSFTHSIFMLSLFAILLTYFSRKFFPNNAYSTQRLFWTVWAVLITHPLLDAFTIFGTQLFWPLNFTPSTWSSVFIIDVIFSLPLLIAFFAILIKGVNQTNLNITKFALCFSIFYLALGIGFRTHAEQKVKNILVEQGEVITDIKGAPLPFGNFTWRILAKNNQDDYYEAIVGAFDKNPPEMIKQTLGHSLLPIIEKNQYNNKLRWFTDDWLSYRVENNQLIASDLRMGISGHLNFQYILAEKNNDNQWENIIPKRLNSNAPPPELLLLPHVWNRVWNSNKPLPLLEWKNR